MTIYLLHFATPFKHAKHYMGFTEDLDARLERHRAGDGARLLRVIKDAGIAFDVARTWQGDRTLERKLKKYKRATALCPVCSPSALSRGNYDKQ
jgi:predicted GIY-YIG superfamily endonuclease